MGYRVNIHRNGSVQTFMAAEGARLLDLLNESGEFLYTPCGGRGTCGKCAVRVEGANTEPSEDEKRCSEKEQERDSGWHAGSGSIQIYLYIPAVPVKNLR